MASTPKRGQAPSGSKGGKAADQRRAKVEEMMRAQAKSRQRSQLGFAALLVAVVLVIAGLVTFGLTRSHSGAATTTADASVVNTITTVPAAAYDTVGASTTGVNPPEKIAGTALTLNNLPEVLYVGAEYCPYCAAERWSFVAALSRFGTFTGLGQTQSSSTDVYPSTNTLSFHGSSYTSKYLTLKTYETEDTSGQPLDKLDSADQAVFSKYDAPPLTTSSSAGSIPFIDIGGDYAVSGASYTPQVLAGMSHAQIAKAIADPTSTVGKNVLTAANYLTASICTLTDNKPADVCTSSAVTAAAAKLPTADVGASGTAPSTGNSSS